MSFYVSQLSFDNFCLQDLNKVRKQAKKMFLIKFYFKKNEL